MPPVLPHLASLPVSLEYERLGPVAPIEMRLSLHEVRRGLARGRGIAPDRHGSIDGRGLEREVGGVIRRGGGAVLYVRVARVTHELRHLLASLDQTVGWDAGTESRAVLAARMRLTAAENLDGEGE